jgi:hypothetical protein
VLVDGFVRGTWKVSRPPGTTILTIQMLEPWSRKDTAAVTAEGGRLLAFVTGDARAAHEIQLVPSN